MQTVNDTEILAGRENNYRFLAELYKKEITGKMLESLRSIDQNAYLGTPLETGYSAIRKYLENAPVDLPTELAADFAKIFLGTGVLEKEQAPAPYESVYTSPERLIMQEARDKVLAIYRSNGVDKIKGLDVPEDHISIELEFMAYLCAETVKAYENGDGKKASRLMETQKSFIKEHLLNWVPSFCQEIDRFAVTDFYKGVALITLAFLNMDKEILDGLMEGAPL